MKVYIEPRDWWVGYFRGDEHHYVLPAAVRRDSLEASCLTQPVRSLLAVSAQAAPTRITMRAAERCGVPTRERRTPADAAGRRPQMSDSATRDTAASKDSSSRVTAVLTSWDYDEPRTDGAT